MVWFRFVSPFWFHVVLIRFHQVRVHVFYVLEILDRLVLLVPLFDCANGWIIWYLQLSFVWLLVIGESGVAERITYNRRSSAHTKITQYQAINPLRKWRHNNLRGSAKPFTSMEKACINSSLPVVFHTTSQGSRLHITSCI